ncbi:MAG TPA: hypothetical protein HPP76_10800 [Desulfuromonadales bacterium]|nr:hypothetical protein [Desulfuromonadales bacterium]
MKARLSAGSSVEARCTRCREVLNHTIVAMIEEKIIRVECNTCHGTHAYHPVKTVKEPKSAKAVAPRKSKADPDAVARAEWAELQPGMDPGQAVPYDMNRAYRMKNLLLHPSFGLGIVQLVIVPNKIDVLFQDGKKRLRCG